MFNLGQLILLIAQKFYDQLVFKESILKDIYPTTNESIRGIQCEFIAFIQFCFSLFFSYVTNHILAWSFYYLILPTFLGNLIR